VPVFLYVAHQNRGEPPKPETDTNSTEYPFRKDFLSPVIFSKTKSRRRVYQADIFALLKIAEGAAGKIPCRHASCSLCVRNNHGQ
jgi:hypothetical protein